MSRITIRYCAVCLHKPRAARVAEMLRQKLGVEVGLEHGGFGEFSVVAGGQVVARRTTIALPKDEDILEAVRAYLQRRGGSDAQPV